MSDLLKRAADASACSMLNDIGSAGTQLAVWTMWTPKVALVPLTVGALGYMANNLLCAEMDGPPETINDRLDGCVKGAPGQGYPLQYWVKETSSWGNSALGLNEITSVGEVVYRNGKWGHWVEGFMADGSAFYSPGGFYATEEDAILYGKYRLNVPEGECGGSNDPDDPGNPTPDIPDYEYTDPETNCNYTLKLEGFVQQYEGGPASPVWNIQSSATTRADGGRMGGCNLSPTIFIGGNGDGPQGPNGPPQIPVPPNPPSPGPDGVPWWLPPLIGATAGAIMNQLGRLFNDTFNYKMNPGGFEFIAPCDKTEEGTPENRTWGWGEEPLILRLHTHQVAMMEMLQQHLNWKTPTCSNDRPQLEGEWRTISFRSDEVSPYGKSRLRKRFRYRSVSGYDLGAIVTHWKDFTWEAGPICVQHSGAPWGTPQVWAATADEGKRVIRHAAGEAGLDPDQVGRWTVGGSRSARIGVSGTMRVDTKGGYYWITARDGSNERPVVAKVLHP